MPPSQVALPKEDIPIARAVLPFVLALCITAACLLLISGLFFKGIGSDGGWYSYPGFEYSRNAPVESNLLSADSHTSTALDGLRAFFHFKTYGSVRTLYTGWWFKAFQPSILSIKFLGLTELALYLSIVFLISLKISGDKLLALILVALLLNDKTLLMAAASDFRPDIAVAAFSWMTFLALLYARSYTTVITVFSCAVLSVLVHQTAVVPIAGILTFFLLRDLFEYRHKDFLTHLIISLLAILALLFSDSLFDLVFLGYGRHIASPVSAIHRIIAAWHRGPLFLLAKEAARWKSYFFATNGAILLIAFLGFYLAVISLVRGVSRRGPLLAMAAATVTSLVLLVLVDPHPAEHHAIPLVPFFLLTIGYALGSAYQFKRLMRIILVSLALVSSFTSMALAYKLYASGIETGYDIVTVQQSLRTALSSFERKPILVLGPTEIWPFLDYRSNITIYDTRRGRVNTVEIAPIIPFVDFVVVNQDYSPEWTNELMQAFPGITLTKTLELGPTRAPLISVHKVGKTLGERR